MKIHSLLLLLLFLSIQASLLSQNKRSITGLYTNTKNNPWIGTDAEKQNVTWSVSITKDSSFVYNYLYDKNVYIKLGQGKWTLKDTIIRLRFYSKAGIENWGRHKYEQYMDNQGQELIYDYDEYIIKDNKLISITDSEVEIRKNVVLFVKTK